MSAENRIKFNCEWCGKEAEQRVSKYNDRKHHFCGRPCFNDWMKRDRIEVKCVVCGKSKAVAQWEIKSNETGNFFCSNKCRLKWHDQKSEINVTKFICENCNCEFKVRNCVLTGLRNKRRFCSKKCEKDWYRNNSRIILNCDNCDLEFDITKSRFEYRESHFCSNKCKYEKFFRGGDDLVWYEDYADKLSGFEEVRKNVLDNRILEVKCTYCGKWIVPTRFDVTTRISWFSGNGRQESRFYCKDSNCKQQCPIFRQIKYPKGYKKATSREVDPELRKEVFKRDNWTCQRCDSIKSLHCHHIEGAVQQPMLANDPENCITLCKSCHRWVHSKEGCTTYDYKCKK